MFPSSAASTAPSEEEAASHDHYNYTIPFSRTKRYLDTVGGDVDPNNISPAVSSALGAISLGATTGLGVSPRTGLLGPAAPSSMYGSEAPSSVGSSSKPPSQQTSTVAASTRSHPTKENKPHAPPPLGGIKVLPTGPVPSSLFKTPKTPAASHVSSASKHTGRPDTKAKVPTPAPSIKPHATISPVLSKARRQNPKAKLNPPSKPSEQPINPSLECHISVDDRPDIPLKARIPKNVDGSKWLNHRPIENFDEGNTNFLFSSPYIGNNNLGCLYRYFSGDLFASLNDYYWFGTSQIIVTLIFFAVNVLFNKSCTNKFWQFGKFLTR